MDDKPSKPGSDSLKRDDDLIAAARRQAEAWTPPGSETETTPAAEGGEVPARFRDLPSDSFPGFEIVKEVHRGGQGVVYQAVQKATKRRVAIKVMHEGPFAGPRDKARFEREVQILAALKHPNIVAIHDSGTAAGHFFYVMDYISGLPLDQYMAGGERSIEETLKLFGKICDAVNAAHLKGVIHRDLKPGNIRIDSKGEPHVLDFGLAKVAMGDMTNDSRPAVMSMTGQFIGSLPWASPEQAEAVPDKIDIRTDVYSLGVILYQMLTGKFPYEVVGNMRDVLDRILRAEPTKPSTIRRQINDEVETIVLKCLQKERERRYQSAGELSRDIGRYLVGEPIEAKHDSAMYVLRKQLRRYKAPIAVACVFVLLLGIFAVVMLVQAERNRRLALSESRAKEQALIAKNEAMAARDEAARQALRAGEQSLRAGETAALLKRMIKAATPEMAQGTNPTVREMLDAASRDLELDRAVHPLVAADTHRTLADAYYSLGEFTRAETHARHAVSLRPTEKTLRSPDALKDATTLARILSRLDRDDEAIQTAREALHAAREDLGPDHPTSINLAVVYAYALVNAVTFDQEEMLRWSREGYERSAAVFGSEDHRALLAASDFGASLMDVGQLDEAERILRFVLETRQRNLGDDHPDVLVSLNNLQAILDRRKDLAGARELGVQIIERADRILGPDHPRTCRYALNLASLNTRLGRLEEAEVYARRALAAAAPRLGPTHPDVLRYRGMLATLLMNLKRLDEAEPMVQEQYDLCLAAFGARDLHTLQAVTLQYDLAETRGRLDEMRRCAEELKGTRWEEAVFERLRAAESARSSSARPRP